MQSRLTGSYGCLALALVMGAAPLVVPAPAAAQVSRASTVMPGSMGIPQPEPLVTLSVPKASVTTIVREIFKQTPYRYQFVGQIGSGAYGLNVNRVPLSKALIALFAQDKRPDPLVFSFTKTPNGGVFTIDREFVEIGEVEGENRVSLANARITRVLPEVFKLMNVKYRIEPDVPPVLVSVQLRPQSWEQVLPQLILEAYKQEPTITYSVDGDTYVVHIQKTPTGVTPSGQILPTAGRKVNLALASAPLKDALAELFNGSQWKYQVSDGVKDVKVTYSASGQPEIAALQEILKHASNQGSPVTYREGKGILYIEPGPLPGLAQVPSGKGGLLGKELTTSLTVNMQPLHQVAKLIAGATGKTLNIAPNVPDLRVSLRVENATFDDAMKALLEAIRASLPNLTYRADPQGKDAYRLELGR